MVLEGLPSKTRKLVFLFFVGLDSTREAANEWEQSPGLVLGNLGGHLLDGRFFF